MHETCHKTYMLIHHKSFDAISRKTCCITNNM